MNFAVIILIVILMFGVLIFVHELGHFLTARLFGVGVNEFSLGMGPALFSRVSQKSGIKYSVRAFPIGGYVSMVGEDRLEAQDDASAALCKKPVWQRFIVMFAGAAMNLILGFVIMAITVLGAKNFYGTTVDSFVFKAQDGQYYRTYDTQYGYGLEVGDRIVKVGNEPIRIYDDLTFEIMRVGSEPTDVTVIRNGIKTTVPDVTFPTYSERGLVFGDATFIYPNFVEKNILTVIQQTFMQSFSTIRMIYESLIDTFTGRYGLAAVSGPVGVVESVGETAKYGFGAIVYMAMILSFNLGIMNLLPFPALDGGRIFFLLVELIRRKPVKPELEGYVHFAGMVVLLLFMVFITYNDIVRLVTG